MCIRDSLTTREFFIDGIKRDRWVWSGDAIQSYLMNYYLFFDNETVKRTIWLLRGKDPVTSHSNTTVSYTHLDVYKRQVFAKANIGDLPFMTVICINGWKGWLPCMPSRKIPNWIN